MFGMGSNPIGDSKFFCASPRNKLRFLIHKISTSSERPVIRRFVLCLDSTEKYFQYEFKIYESKCQRTVNIRGNSAMLPFDVIDFAILPAQRFLAGNSGIGRCHVVSR